MIWCWGISNNISCNTASRGCFYAIIMRWTLCPKMSQKCQNCRHVWWANCPVNAHNIVFADSSEVCSCIVILGLVLSLVFARKGRTTDLNTSSMYTGLIKCPSLITRFVNLGFKHLHLLRDLANVMKTYVCSVNWFFAKNGVKTSKLWHGSTKTLWALQTKIKRHYKEKWSHYTIVKFKSLQMFLIFCHSS